MFFTNHNKILVQGNKTNSVKTITDITASISFFQKLKNTKMYNRYNIVEGDTPESLSDALYDTQEYSWTILLANQIKDVNREWPLSSVQFDKYMQTKYGDYISLFLKLDSIKKYDIKNGDIVCVIGSQDTDKAEVIEWNPSLSKLIVKLLTEDTFEINNKIALLSNPNEEIGTIGRIVNYEVQSLHHFESNGEYIDPLLGSLQSYINGSNENVVTNYDYEMKQNDLKRSIFVINKNYIQQIIKQYNSLMASP